MIDLNSMYLKALYLKVGPPVFDILKKCNKAGYLNMFKDLNELVEYLGARPVLTKLVQ